MAQEASQAASQAASAEPPRVFGLFPNQTGSLAALMVERDASVIGIDASARMVAVAKRNCQQGSFFKMSAVEIERFEPGKFDLLVSTLCFSE